ncbi:uncharacterized protein si:ch211-195b21.5 isoform X2 [Takifugu flavidus]|uniref:uncharacterized protein si:ch211-195b21.5 isoform X2 n=1 Tax=Takifugu flavidus TaxID=433684 RepID=UPI0025444066|nr:uncharacterized protein si:ch211-195b21.5 isoform X2 [Takifugu flavidus]
MDPRNQRNQRNHLYAAAPPFGSAHSRDPPVSSGGFRGAPFGHLPPATARPFRHHQPRFATPQCSSYPADYYAMIGLGRPHQRLPLWTPTPAPCPRPHLSDRASEEFLRCIAANEPLPHYLKENLDYSLADAFSRSRGKSRARSRSRGKSRARSRSRGKSRARSRSRGRSGARSRSRGKSRARSRSRGKSRPRSRSRGKSRARSRSRGKSRARSRSRGRSGARSRSRGKSPARSRSRGRSKSHARGTSAQRERGSCGSWGQNRISSPTQSRTRGQRSGSSGEMDQNKRGNRSSVDQDETSPGGSLLKGLQMVLSSQELGGRFSNLTDALLGMKAFGESKEEQVPLGGQQETSGEDLITLPHDRVGSDFFWLQAPNQKDSGVHKDEALEAEESFLYGKEAASRSFSETSCREKPGGAPETSTFGGVEDLLNVQQHLQNTSRIASALLDSSTCERIKSVLSCLGSAHVVTGQEPEEEPLLSPAPTASPLTGQPNMLQALQSSITAAQETCSQLDGNPTSQIPAGQHQMDEEEDRSRLKRATAGKMEVLMKELQKLMKHNGFSFLTPVIGFYCQKCEEFFGDWSSAENHAATHCCPCSAEVRLDKCGGRDGTTQQHPADKEGHEDSRYRGNPGVQTVDGEWREERDHRNRHHPDHRSRKESLFLEEEMKKERMLITVSQEPEPPSHRKDPQAPKVNTATMVSNSKCSSSTLEENETSGKEKTIKTKSHKKKKKKKTHGKKKNKES